MGTASDHPLPEHLLNLAGLLSSIAGQAAALSSTPRIDAAASAPCPPPLELSWPLQYMVEIWRAVGMDMTRVQFLSASEEINKRPDEYWSLVMDIARRNNLKRIVRYLLQPCSWPTA